MAAYIITAGNEQAIVLNYDSREEVIAAFREICPDTPIDKIEECVNPSILFREAH